MFGNHTRSERQPVIIRLFAAVGVLVAVTRMGAAADQLPPTPVPVACVSCVILAVPAPQAAALSVSAGALTGLTIVVDGGDPAADDALDRLSAAGAEAGVRLVTGQPPRGATFAKASVIVVNGVSDTRESIFEVRTLVVDARARRPDVRVLIQAEAVPYALRAYVQGRVDSGPRLAEADVDLLTELSTKSGADPVVIEVDAITAGALMAFAARRPFGTEVVAARALTAEEIVSRHQAQRRRQDSIVRRTIARGTTTLLFEVPGFVAPVVVTARSTIYREPGLVEIEQEDVRVNGAAIAGGDAASPPRLPLIEAERVATPPLTITLDEAYHYERELDERLDGEDVHVVRFAPRAAGAGLTRGRVWFDAGTFGLRRMAIVQEHLSGAIVSSEQREEFARFDAGAGHVWLPVRTYVYQMYEGAGHRTPIHRTIDTRDYALDPLDFDTRRRAAHASSHLMLRETPHGFRYLLRPEGGSAETSRVVADTAGQRVRTAVFGVLVDPNITVPLPFAGFSYVDLNLFGTGAQLNAFFGGTYGQLSWSIPALAGTRWQAGGRAFAIAARFNDRAFRDGVEQYGENITQRPAHLSAGVMRPLAARLRARFDYAVDYVSFDRASSTLSEFVVPADLLVHGFVATLEGESGPWLGRVWWNPARRQTWRGWGLDPGSSNRGRAYQRFGAAAARTIALGPRVSSRIELTAFGGVNLDRFSRFSFDAFENRLHGYPTASIRYDRGGIIRSVTSWAPRAVRVDAFVDAAVVRDPGFGANLRRYEGVGAAVEAGGPFRSLLTLEWGYGFRARQRDGGEGTHAVRLTAYRTF
jgi:hypothetical protein